ncbi:hypothetical protein, partial [Rhodopirellula sp. UBA1907]|uniref:hypothetical protein n=1 Tax=Rhodopirellula sp. UBA1907 TaxID=1947381 RepID=UPI00257B289A
MGIAKKVARRREEHVGLGSREHTAIDRNRAVWKGEVDALIDDSQTIVTVRKELRRERCVVGGGTVFCGCRLEGPSR